MAKADNVSFLESHIEKIALLACLALLGAAAYHWLFSSPVALTVIPPSGRGKSIRVSPKEADQVLSDAAQSVRDMWDRAVQRVEPVPEWAGGVLALRKIDLPPEPVELALPGLELRLEEEVKGIKKVRLKDVLAAMPLPAKPVAAAYTELPKRMPLADARVARGLALYPANQLATAWTNLLGPHGVTVRLVARKMIVESQERQADGQWGPVQVVTIARRPRVNAAGEELKPPVIPALAPDGKNVQDVRGKRDELAQPTWQEYILRPEYYQIYLPVRGGWVDWKVHLPTVTRQAGDAVVLFHDEGTMKVGSSYRYRVKLVFVNPILTYEGAVKPKDIGDTRVAEVATQFGGWSDPVSVTREVHFFLTGASETTRQMTVTVYVHKWGQWVKQTFQIKPGDAIGGKKSVDMIHPLGQPGETTRVEVDFSTVAAALRFHFTKVLMERGSFRRRAPELLYVDKDGKLASRILPLDSDDTLRQELEKLVKQARGG